MRMGTWDREVDTWTGLALGGCGGSGWAGGLTGQRQPHGRLSECRHRLGFCAGSEGSGGGENVRRAYHVRPATPRRGEPLLPRWEG